MDKRKTPLMPKATAMWLIEHTALTFKQIGDFCGFHELEIGAMADGDVAKGIVGIDPRAAGQLSQTEIDRCTQDQQASLQLSIDELYESVKGIRPNRARYTPISRRQDKPDAISWLLKNCPGISDREIIKLIGTTKYTISSIRTRAHWNIQGIRPRDPVLLGLCTQRRLDEIVAKFPLVTPVGDAER